LIHLTVGQGFQGFVTSFASEYAIGVVRLWLQRIAENTVSLPRAIHQKAHSNRQVVDDDLQTSTRIPQVPKRPRVETMAVIWSS
jgi:hypothetical protein